MLSEMPSGGRAVERCNLLGTGPYSGAPDMLYRAYLTPSHRATIEQVCIWMTEAGMSCRLDPAGNLVGRYDGIMGGAPALLIGSHLDSVRDAGRYDGPLGVMLGIECVAALHREGRRLPFPIEIVGFGDEEGSRFPTAMLCSRSLAGSLDPATLEIADADGVLLADALTRFGLDPARYCQAARPADGVLAFLEAHIEQGPVLEARGLPIGIVTAIAAQSRFQIRVEGHAGHAGTTAMTLRKDALTAAAEMILAIERVGRDGPADLVATVGRMNVLPGAINVVPGKVEFSIDVRAGDRTTRDDAAARILWELDAVATTRGVRLTPEKLQDLPATPCDGGLIELLDRAIVAEGIAPFRLVSGAGHDAMIMEKLCPSVMLFIRCAGGISHNPMETVDPADAEAALHVMRRFIEQLRERFEERGVPCG